MLTPADGVGSAGEADQVQLQTDSPSGRAAVKVSRPVRGLNSGGGTLTSYIAAVDERVRVPVDGVEQV